MNNNCYTGTNVPPILETEPCEGIYKDDTCVIHESAIPYLKLPANSSVKNIINNLVLALVPKYKVYTALLSQSGTNVPTATVLENTLETELSFTYIGSGNYAIVSSIPLIIGKTTIELKNTFNFSEIIAVVNVVDEFNFNLYIEADGQPGVNGVMTNTPIEIRVYN